MYVLRDTLPIDDLRIRIECLLNNRQNSVYIYDSFFFSLRVHALSLFLYNYLYKSVQVGVSCNVQ